MQKSVLSLPLVFRRILAGTFFFSCAFGWTAERYCYQPAQLTSQKLIFILSSQRADQMSAAVKNQYLEQKVIRVREVNNLPAVQYTSTWIQPGDCFLLNPMEKATLTVIQDTTLLYRRSETFWHMLKRFTSEFFDRFKKGEKKELYPAILFSGNTGSKSFGWLPVESLKQLSRRHDYHEMSSVDLLNFKPSFNKIILAYLICPSDRNEVCHMTFKKDGKWVKNSKGEKVQFRALARSKRGSQEWGSRIQFRSDIPQGIYYFWATMFSDDLWYGKIPRIDIDAGLPPINCARYPIHALTLSQILPSSAWDEYWVNEWALAYAVGRNLFRIHANSVEEHPEYIYETPQSHLSFAEGSINAGSEMPKILSTLASLGVFHANDIVPVKNPNTKTLEWKVSPALGRAFLIVKDEESKKQ